MRVAAWDIVSLIVGVLTFAGVIAGVVITSKNTQKQRNANIVTKFRLEWAHTFQEIIISFLTNLDTVIYDEEIDSKLFNNLILNYHKMRMHISFSEFHYGVSLLDKISDVLELVRKTIYCEDKQVTAQCEEALIYGKKMIINEANSIFSTLWLIIREESIKGKSNDYNMGYTYYGEMRSAENGASQEEYEKSKRKIKKIEREIKKKNHSTTSN